MENKTIDTYWEHSQHFSYRNDCSECYKEQRLNRSSRTAELGTNIVGYKEQDYQFNRNPND